MIIGSIDYSMNSPCVAVYDTDTELKFENFKILNINKVKKYTGWFGNITLLSPKEYNTEEERYRNTASEIFSFLRNHGVEFVCMEGFSMGSSVGLLTQIAENASVLKQMLDIAKIPFITPAPTSIKKHFSGSGSAKKEQMVDTFINKFGVSVADIIGQDNKYGSPTNDIVDSVAIMLYGMKELKLVK